MNIRMLIHAHVLGIISVCVCVSVGLTSCDVIQREE